GPAHGPLRGHPTVVRVDPGQPQSPVGAWRLDRPEPPVPDGTGVRALRGGMPASPATIRGDAQDAGRQQVPGATGGAEALSAEAGFPDRVPGTDLCRGCQMETAGRDGCCPQLRVEPERLLSAFRLRSALSGRGRTTGVGVPAVRYVWQGLGPLRS